MKTKKRKKRLYLRFSENSLNAVRSGIAAFNDVHDVYKYEITLILLVNAWELLGKAILIKQKKSIAKDKNGKTFSAEEVVWKMFLDGMLDENQNQHIQQLISLRNEAAHAVLPPISIEIFHHLFYFSCKFYKDILVKEFPQYKDRIAINFLSLAFDDLTTYADKVQKLVGRLRKGNEGEKQLVWLLERGIRFDGVAYIPQNKFEQEFKDKSNKKILPHLHINKYLKNVDMVRIVPVQAPKNYTADIILRRGNQTSLGLPIAIKKTEIEQDYPYLAGEIGKKINKHAHFVALAMSKLKLKDDSQYHQSVRSSKSSRVNRYSDSALNFLKKYLEDNPNFNPYK